MSEIGHNGIGLDDFPNNTCPMCGASRGNGHAEDCVTGEKHHKDEQCSSPGGYVPPHIADWMGDRNILTVCLDIVGGVRGGRDMCLSDCATWLGCVEWYIDHWRPSDCQFDAIVLQMLTQTKRIGNEWFLRESLRMERKA